MYNVELELVRMHLNAIRDRKDPTAACQLIGRQDEAAAIIMHSVQEREEQREKEALVLVGQMVKVANFADGAKIEKGWMIEDWKICCVVEFVA